MYNKILVPLALYQDRDTGAALDIARSLADKNAEIVALTVIDPVPAHAMAYLPEGHGDKLLAETEAELKSELGWVKDVKPAVISGQSGRAIVEYAEEHGVGCIVIASHRPGFKDFFIGSTASYVVGHASCAVHVVR